MTRKTCQQSSAAGEAGDGPWRNGHVEAMLTLTSLMLHRVFRIRQHVPRRPETSHIVRPPQRYTDIGAHGGKASSDLDIVSAEVLYHVFRRMKRIHHDKIGMGFDWFNGTSHRLIETFLTVVHVAANRFIHFVDVVQGGGSSLTDDGVDVVLSGEFPHPLNRIWRCHRVAQSQPRQAINAGKRPGDDDPFVFDRVIDEGAIHSRLTGVVVVGLVDHSKGGRRKLVNELLQVLPGSEGCSGIVWVADVYKGRRMARR
jgi:hypothetical protein